MIFPNCAGMLCDICEEKITPETVGLSVAEFNGPATVVVAVFHNTCWLSALRWAGRAALKERKAKEVPTE